MDRQHNDDRIVEQAHPKTGAVDGKRAHTLPLHVLVPEVRHRLAGEDANERHGRRPDEHEGDHGPARVPETYLREDGDVDEDDGDLQDGAEPGVDGLADEDLVWEVS
jgi:hypothetical protein